MHKLKKGMIFIMMLAILASVFASCSNNKEWNLSAPVYKWGKQSENTYNIGDGINYKADAVGGKMSVISDTNIKHFNKYLKLLSKKGYEEITRNEINNNIFIQYKNGDSLLYVYYIDKYKEVRIIEDYVSVPENEFEYTYSPENGQATTVYQYGLMTDPTGAGSGQNCEGKWSNCGMFYIIHLSDNSLFLIDGGNPPLSASTVNVQATIEGTRDLLDFMYEITGLSKEEKIRISGVYFTHAHIDHCGYTALLLTHFSDKIEVERAIYNFPSSQYLQMGTESTFDEIGNMLKGNYPDIKFIKPHTGQKINLADIQMEILFTHEDFVSAQTGLTQIIDTNNTSTVAKFTINSRTLMMLGDIGGQWDMAREDYFVFEDRFINMYTDGEFFPVEKTFLNCDIVQVAHHGINFYMENIFYAIEPEYAFFPQADCKTSQLYHDCYKTVLTQLNMAGVLSGKIYFMGRYTHGMKIDQDGTITVTKSPIRGTINGYNDYLANFEPFVQ